MSETVVFLNAGLRSRTRLGSRTRVVFGERKNAKKNAERRKERGARSYGQNACSLHLRSCPRRPGSSSAGRSQRNCSTRATPRPSRRSFGRCPPRRLRRMRVSGTPRAHVSSTAASHQMAPPRPRIWRWSSTRCGRTQSSTTPSRRRLGMLTVHRRQPPCGCTANAFCRGSWAAATWTTTKCPPSWRRPCARWWRSSAGCWPCWTPRQACCAAARRTWTSSFLCLVTFVLTGAFGAGAGVASVVVGVNPGPKAPGQGVEGQGFLFLLMLLNVKFLDQVVIAILISVPFCCQECSRRDAQHGVVAAQGEGAVPDHLQVPGLESARRRLPALLRGVHRAWQRAP